MMPRSPSPSLPGRQRGAATLVVVMVLFLIMALLAAYANRSLLFEQRISANFYRASVSAEASEAAIEWTLAQLNGPAVDNACKPVVAGGQRFADRYLTISTTDRRITPNAKEKPGVDCAREVGGDGWNCRCLEAGGAHPARAALPGGEQSPSFGIFEMAAGKRGGTFAIRVVGCSTSAFGTCFGDLGEISSQQISRNLVDVTLGLVSAVRSPPATPLVVRGDVDSTGDGLGLHNADPRTTGMLATLGGNWTGMVDGRLESVPGTSAAQTVSQGDATLKNSADAEAVFRMFMGASSMRFQQHPSLRKLSCSGDCAGALEKAYQAGQRMVWVEGKLDLTSNKVIGSISDPMLVVASGNVTLDGPFQFSGMLVTLGNLAWTNAAGAPSVINGIVLVGGAVRTEGRMDIVYQQIVTDNLSNRMGSYVRVPGSWLDNRDL